MVSILARDAGDLPIKFQMLIYPGAKINPTAAGDGNAPVLGNDFLNYYKNHYLENDEQALDWRASPILCPDLTNLPPTFMVTAGNDPLHEDSLELAQKLSEAGNKCTAITFERQVHGFVTLARSIDEAQTAISICAAELRRQLA